MPGACRSPRKQEQIVKEPRSYTGQYLKPLLLSGERSAQAAE